MEEAVRVFSFNLDLLHKTSYIIKAHFYTLQLPPHRPDLVKINLIIVGMSLGWPIGPFVLKPANGKMYDATNTVAVALAQVSIWEKKGRVPWSS